MAVGRRQRGVSEPKVSAESGTINFPTTRIRDKELKKDRTGSEMSPSGLRKPSSHGENVLGAINSVLEKRRLITRLCSVFRASGNNLVISTHHFSEFENIFSKMDITKILSNTKFCFNIISLNIIFRFFNIAFSVVK